MIYLIGGSPRGGKTILSKKLAKKINASYLSTDYIKLAIIPYYKKKERLKKFPFMKIWKFKKLEDYFITYNGKQMVNIDIQEGKSIWAGMEHLISHLSKGSTDYVIEGVHLLPNLVKKIKNNPNIKIVFLTKINEEKIYNGLFKNKSKKDWILDKIKDKKIIKLVAKALSVYGYYFEKETKKYNLKLINTEDNFSTKINEAMKFFLKK